MGKKPCPECGAMFDLKKIICPECGNGAEKVASDFIHKKGVFKQCPDRKDDRSGCKLDADAQCDAVDCPRGREYWHKVYADAEESKQPYYRKQEAAFKKLQEGLIELDEKLKALKDKIHDDEVPVDEFARLDEMVIITALGAKKMMLYAEYFGVPLELLQQGGVKTKFG